MTVLDKAAADKRYKFVKAINEIRLFEFEGDVTTKTMNGGPIIKKMDTIENILYFFKEITYILKRQVEQRLKQQTHINADYYDIMFVFNKKINEAVIDAWNEYVKLRRKDLNL